MSEALVNILFTPPEAGKRLPDHKDLPETDGSIAQNFQEHPQSMLLTDSLQPVLQRLHPDGQCAIGQDCGIYWLYTDPPLDGCRAPDWFYVPGVSPLLHGEVRRSYVLWYEPIRPLLGLEYVSGDGSEERDRTPYTGKFWIYEQAILFNYYGIYEVKPGRVEMYHRVDSRFELMPANERGHYPIPPLGVELGIWQGRYMDMELPWMRWWDAEGNLLLTGAERAEQERAAKELALRSADQERVAKELAQNAVDQERLAREQAQREIERLAALLRSLGVDPNQK